MRFFFVLFQQEGALFVTFPKPLVLVEQPFSGGILTGQKGSARDLFMAVVVETRIISGPEGSVNGDALVEVSVYIPYTPKLTASTWYVEGLAFCAVRNRKYETDLLWPFPGIFASSEFSRCIFFCFESVLCPSVVIDIRNLTQTKKESNSTWTERIFRTGCHWPKAEDLMIYATMRWASYLQIKSFPINWMLNTLVKATFAITFATAN